MRWNETTKRWVNEKKVVEKKVKKVEPIASKKVKGCKVKGCIDKHYAKDLCHNHYLQDYRGNLHLEPDNSIAIRYKNLRPSHISNEEWEDFIK